MKDLKEGTAMPESTYISEAIPVIIGGTPFYAQLVGGAVNIYDGASGDFLRDFENAEEAFRWAEKLMAKESL